MAHRRRRRTQPRAKPSPRAELSPAKSFNLNFAPIYAGGLEKAAVMESALQFLFAIAQGGMGPFFYRMAPPGQF